MNENVEEGGLDLFVFRKLSKNFNTSFLTPAFLSNLSAEMRAVLVWDRATAT
jgi:hypothetical protein